MNKIRLCIVVSALVVASATVAFSNSALPNQARENYDIRSDNEKDRTAAAAISGIPVSQGYLRGELQKPESRRNPTNEIHI
jgi:hypothetical protein